jgi:cyclopropane-fatty-acyl-phospholipid synthase
MSLPHLNTAISAPKFDRLTPLQSIARRFVHRQLKRLSRGCISLVDVDGMRYEFGDLSSALQSEIRVHNAAFYTSLCLGGANGAAEAWCLGYWHSERLTDLLRIFVRNREPRRQMEGGLTRLVAPLRRLRYWLQRNNRRGSRVNIAAHYDLGNDFFALFLDPSMMYSSAIFEPSDIDLEAASMVKLRAICDMLDLKPGQHILEIGCGWGALAELVASEYDCYVTATTISEEQYTYTRKRLEKAGLQDRVTVVKRDYRDFDKQYDHIVSIEMIEAVGAENYARYFETVSRCLRPGGRFVMQAITIGDDEFERARHEVDFIKRYIFPGSCIPSLQALRSAARQAGLNWQGEHDITAHYATTLAAWRQRFHANRSAVSALGLPETFQRMWHYYFCYCEAGFAERYIGDYQITMAKPR